MAKKARLPRPVPEPKEETHLQLFARLAAVKNMHGHPGPRKPKGSGK
jgi:hypothetical protein